MSENKIPGINMEAGLELYDGDTDIYKMVLGCFVSETPDKLNRIRDVTRENLPEYVLIMHGLKSVGTTIGAEEISKRAKALEAAAKDGDLHGILAANSDFVKDMTELVKNAQQWLKTFG
jgi:HPt (histidine-containing phosphotransfer) domain-containing protein